MNLVGFLLFTPPILLALSFHEYAHAWTAHKLGDTTAKDLGRLTLNPIAHIDILGLLMLYLVHLGWAKPVPVNPYNFKNPKQDMLWVALAGPVSNLILALIAGIVIRGIQNFAQFDGEGSSFIGILIQMLIIGFVINLVLAFFNLIPIPPLDGSKILRGLLPSRYELAMWNFERIGPFLILGLVLISNLAGISLFWPLIMPFVKFFSFLFAGQDLTVFL